MFSILCIWSFFLIADRSPLFCFFIHIFYFHSRKRCDVSKVRTAYNVEPSMTDRSPTSDQSPLSYPHNILGLFSVFSPFTSTPSQRTTFRPSTSGFYIKCSVYFIRNLSVGSVNDDLLGSSIARMYVTASTVIPSVTHTRGLFVLSFEAAFAHTTHFGSVIALKTKLGVSSAEHFKAKSSMSLFVFWSFYPLDKRVENCSFYPLNKHVLRMVVPWTVLTASLAKVMEFKTKHVTHVGRD